MGDLDYLADPSSSGGQVLVLAVPGAAPRRRRLQRQAHDHGHRTVLRR